MTTPEETYAEENSKCTTGDIKNRSIRALLADIEVLLTEIRDKP